MSDQISHQEKEIVPEGGGKPKGKPVDRITYLELGIAIGTALGAVFNNIPIGIALGLIFGLLLGQFAVKEK